MIRVLIADDEALVRGAFRVLVDSAEGLQAVGEAADGAQAVALAKDLRPDVVLMDIRMPVLDGLEATRQILATGSDPPIRLIVLTTFDLDEYVYMALKLGASGFLLKDTPPETLLSGIRLVARGEALLSPNVMRHVIEEFVRMPEARSATGAAPAGLEGLTARELEVLSLVAQGRSNTEIGERLYVTPATVKTHISRLLMKLQARDRAQLIVISYESGLVSPRPRS